MSTTAPVKIGIIGSEGRMGKALPQSNQRIDALF